MIVSSSEPIAIVGGADIGHNDLSITLAVTQKIAAADGGANHLLAAGIKPNAVIGDLDSISDAARAAFQDVLYSLDDQDTTDFEKVLSRIDAPACVGVGFMGGRLDHTMAVLNVMARYPDRPVVMLGAEDVVFVINHKTVSLHLSESTAFSVLPLEPSVVTTKGLQWDLADAELSMTGLISSSNMTRAAQVEVTVSGIVAITLPRSALAAALIAVRAE